MFIYENMHVTSHFLRIEHAMGSNLKKQVVQVEYNLRFYVTIITKITKFMGITLLEKCAGGGGALQRKTTPYIRYCFSGTCVV